MRKPLVIAALVAALAAPVAAAPSAEALRPSQPTNVAPAAVTAPPAAMPAATRAKWKNVASRKLYLSDKYHVGTLYRQKLQQRGTNATRWVLQTHRSIKIGRTTWKPTQQTDSSQSSFANFNGHWKLADARGCIRDDGVLDHAWYYGGGRVIGDGMDGKAMLTVNGKRPWYLFATQQWTPDGHPPMRAGNFPTPTRTWDVLDRINHPKGKPQPGFWECSGGGGSW